MPLIPNLVGMTVTAAKDARNAAGFTAGTLGGVQQSPYHIVLAQNPAAGVDKPTGTAINITQSYFLHTDGVIWGS